MRFPTLGATRTRGMFRTLDAPSRVTLRVTRFKAIENHWPGPCRECDTVNQQADPDALTADDLRVLGSAGYR